MRTSRFSRMPRLPFTEVMTHKSQRSGELRQRIEDSVVRTASKRGGGQRQSFRVSRSDSHLRSPIQGSSHTALSKPKFDSLYHRGSTTTLVYSQLFRLSHCSCDNINFLLQVRMSAPAHISRVLSARVGIGTSFSLNYIFQLFG